LLNWCKTTITYHLTSGNTYHFGIYVNFTCQTICLKIKILQLV